jgi:hypothetical protein
MNKGYKFLKKKAQCRNIEPKTLNFNYEKNEFISVIRIESA